MLQSDSSSTPTPSPRGCTPRHLHIALKDDVDDAVHGASDSQRLEKRDSDASILDLIAPDTGFAQCRYHTDLVGSFEHSTVPAFRTAIIPDTLPVHLESHGPLNRSTRIVPEVSR